MRYIPLEIKIACNGVKPSKSEVYTLAAELQELHRLEYFKEAIVSALMSYDYYADYYSYDYSYSYSYDYYDYYSYSYSYSCHDDYDYDYSSSEKTLALLFLAAMYS